MIMSRILALQALSSQSTMDFVAASNQSNNCSSETTACSTQSTNGCGKDELLAW
jgi:hypothetical protein